MKTITLSGEQVRELRMALNRHVEELESVIADRVKARFPADSTGWLRDHLDIARQILDAVAA